MPLICDEDQGIFRFTIKRPERLNGIGPEMGVQLAEALANLEARLLQPHPPRVLIITAEPITDRSPPIWVAGGDIKELVGLSSKEAQHFSQLMRGFCFGLLQLPLPVITAVHGLAIGGGAELALFGDLRYATNASQFHFKELSMGLVTIFGGSERLCQLVGEGRGLELLLASEPVMGEQLVNWGLVSKLFPDPEALWQGVLQKARELCQLDPKVIAEQKAIFQSPSHRVAREEEAFLRLWDQKARIKSMEAFLRKA